MMALMFHPLLAKQFMRSFIRKLRRSIGIVCHGAKIWYFKSVFLSSMLMCVGYRRGPHFTRSLWSFLVSSIISFHDFYRILWSQLSYIKERHPVLVLRVYSFPCVSIFFLLLWQRWGTRNHGNEVCSHVTLAGTKMSSELVATYSALGTKDDDDCYYKGPECLGEWIK